MITIEVFQISDRQYRNFLEQEEEEDYILFECDLIEREFINIDNFGLHIDHTTKARCTSFYSGCMEWISPLPPEEFKKMIIKHGTINRQPGRTISKGE